MSDATETGACLCGEVKFSLDRSKVLMASHCHCRDCQRATGSGFATFVAVPDATFEISSGDVGEFSVKGESGGEVTRFFCRNCGTPLFSRVAAMAGFSFVKAGILDDASWVEPSSSYWGDTAQPWAPANTAIPVHARNPSG